MITSAESPYDRSTVSPAQGGDVPGWNKQLPAAAAAVDSADLLAAVWRYRWAVIVPTIVGAIVGFIVFLKTPETHQSATRLMFESNRPAVLDNMTGNIVGGVPSIDILRSQLFSDTVMKNAFEDASFATFRAKFDDNPAAFAGVSRDALTFEADAHGSRDASSLVATLAFKNTDSELCVGAVTAYTAALLQLFEDKHKSSRSELMHLISVATDQLQPKIAELEQRHQKFLREAPLAWNEEGKAVNPHRERQLFLTGRRSELYESSRQKKTELVAIQSIATEGKDPQISLSIIGQMLGKTFAIADSAQSRQDMREGDTLLKQLELDEKLIPLMIERNKHAASVGEAHPTVKQLDIELKMMKSELKRLVTKQAERIVELMEMNKVEGIDPATRAQEALDVILLATQAEVGLLDQQIEELDQQILVEKDEAAKLAKYEQENTAMLREIDRNRELINQLEGQMARIEISDEDGGLRVTELSAPRGAYRVGPNLFLMLGGGTFLGLALGCGLALLLEKNANTFRDPEEISEVVGAPILTHVPFFKGRVRKASKDNPNPFENLDPYLAVVHQPASVPAEAIRSCRTSIFFDLSHIPGGKLIQVSSPLPSDGKSTIAGNLACSIAQSGKRTLVIDADLRRPQITDNFDATEKLGLIDVLNGHCEHVEAIHDTPLATLKIMPSGPIPANPAEALTLPEMGELLDLLRDEFDYIVVDTPPLLVVTDPSIIASMVDAVVMTLRIRRKSKPNLKEAAGILRTVGARVIGVVVNNSDESGSSDGYKGYGYYRYGRHTSRYYRQSKENGPKAGRLRTPVVVSGRATALRASAVPAKPTSVAAGPANGASRKDV